MDINITYNIYLGHPRSWDIIKEQLSKLYDTGLYKLSKKITISGANCSEKDQLELKEFLLENYPKIQTKNLFKENLFEYPGFKTMYEEATNNSLFLYFHTKGATSNLNHQRNLLFEHTIKNYNIYTQEFKDNPNLEVAGLYPHGAGFIFFNFFWVRGDYILNYWDNPSKQTLNNRFIWEVFTGDEFCSKSNITTFSPVVGYEKHDKKSVLNDNRYPFNIY